MSDRVTRFASIITIYTEGLRTHYVISWMMGRAGRPISRGRWVGGGGAGRARCVRCPGLMADGGMGHPAQRSALLAVHKARQAQIVLAL